MDCSCRHRAGESVVNSELGLSLCKPRKHEKQSSLRFSERWSFYKQLQRSYTKHKAFLTLPRIIKSLPDLFALLGIWAPALSLRCGWDTGPCLKDRERPQCSLMLHAVVASPITVWPRRSVIMQLKISCCWRSSLPPTAFAVTLMWSWISSIY